MKYSFLFFILLSFALYSCSKESSHQFMPDLSNSFNDTLWRSSIPPSAPVNELNKLLATPPLADSFLVSKGDTLHFNEVQLIFSPNCFQENIRDYAHVQLNYIKTKGDWIRFALSTIQNHTVFNSGGAFFISAYKNGIPLHMADSSVFQLHYTFPTNNSVMNVLYGMKELNGLTWHSNNQQVLPWKAANGAAGYEINSSQLGWIAAANLQNFSETDKLNVWLPPNFTNMNTIVYVLFNNQLSVISLQADAVNRLFYTSFIPQNTSVTLVSITYTGSMWYKSSKDIVFPQEKLIKLQPTATNLEAVNSFLNSL